MKWFVVLLLSLLGSALVYRMFFQGTDAGVQQAALDEMYREATYQREG